MSANLKTLYGFELKKIFQRKLTWIVLLLLTGFSVCTTIDVTMSSYTYNGQQVSGYTNLQYTQANAQKLEGRPIDETLVSEMRQAYANQASYGPNPYLSTYEFCSSVFGKNYDATSVTADQLYRQRQTLLNKFMDEQALTNKGQQYWREQEDSLQKPFVYRYCDGWDKMFNIIFTSIILIMFLAAVCMSVVFAHEYSYRTDQLVLCSKNGRFTIYLAKLLAGLSVTLGSAVLFFAAMAVPIVFLYGTANFDAPIQLFYPLTSMNWTIGQAICLVTVAYFASAVFYCLLTLFLSIIIKNSVAIVGLLTGVTFIGMFSGNLIPAHLHIPYILFNLIPTRLSIVVDYPISVFGHMCTLIETAPVVYITLSVLLALAGAVQYRRSQISGR